MRIEPLTSTPAIEDETMTMLRFDLRLALLLGLPLLLAACGTESAGEDDLCASAAAHVGECLGRSGDSVLGADCDPAAAQNLLQQDCDGIAASLQQESGDVKTDGPIDAIGCWLNLVPLEKCVPETYIGIDVQAQVWRQDGEQMVAYPGVKLRFTEESNPQAVVNAVSDGKGDAFFKLPTSIFGGRMFKFEVFENDELCYVAKFKGNFFYLDVRFAADGTVTACKWIDDDACVDF